MIVSIMVSLAFITLSALGSRGFLEAVLLGVPDILRGPTAFVGGLALSMGIYELARQRGELLLKLEFETIPRKIAELKKEIRSRRMAQAILMVTTVTGTAMLCIAGVQHRYEAEEQIRVLQKTSEIRPPQLHVTDVSKAIDNLSEGAKRHGTVSKSHQKVADLLKQQNRQQQLAYDLYTRHQESLAKKQARVDSLYQEKNKSKLASALVGAVRWLIEVSGAEYSRKREETWVRTISMILGIVLALAVDYCGGQLGTQIDFNQLVGRVGADTTSRRRVFGNGKLRKEIKR